MGMQSMWRSIFVAAQRGSIFIYRVIRFGSISTAKWLDSYDYGARK